MHDEVQNESWVHEDETHNKHRTDKSHTIKKLMYHPKMLIISEILQAIIIP